MSIVERAKKLVYDIEEVELNQKAMAKSKQQLSKNIEDLKIQKQISEEELEIVTNAVAILKDISDGVVVENRKFIEESLNSALERIFKKSTRKIRIKEYTARGTYPQLELELQVEGGEIRLLKNSGHGLMQIVSLLCVLSLIVMTGNRRLLVLDEVLSGLSARTRKIVDDILWVFTSIGFQFIINEHGFIPKGAKVVKLEMQSGLSSVTNTYIENNGVYLDGKMIDEVDEVVDKIKLAGIVNNEDTNTNEVEGI